MKEILFILSLLFTFTGWAQPDFILVSPDGKLQTEIYLDKNIEYRLIYAGEVLIDRSPVSMEIAGNKSFGINPKVQSSGTRTVNEVIIPPVYKKAEINDHYNELSLKMKGDYQLLFRAYNEGMAYRFVSNLKGDYRILNEQATFNIPDAKTAWIPYVRGPEMQQEWEEEILLDPAKSPFNKQYGNSFENTYIESLLSEWQTGRLAFLPVVMEVNNKKVAIAEADLFGYPGMFLHKNKNTTNLQGIFAPYPEEVKHGGNGHQEMVVSRKPYMASIKGPKKFPWRIVIVAEKDYELANNDMVYKLAEPARFNDFSWIKPGKAAWEWWSYWNLYGVDFKSGINNDTYKYFINFAAENNLEYVILDDGWTISQEYDLFKVKPELNIPELVAYAEQKQVGLILWCGYFSFNKDIEGVCKHYSEMGIKGFKVDFMDRDDQVMTEFYEKVAQTAAKYKLLIDFHGTYKPTGLQRTYPNIINFEGVFGLEMVKFFEEDMVMNEVIVPFTRMIAGPLDYTQGAMRNASKENFRSIDGEPMSQGTRCRQLAQYVIFESPLSMLCDSPSNYLAEPECFSFISSVPVTWDETIALNGEIGKYITIARRKNDDWYVGSLTDWQERQLKLDLSFLPEGNYRAEVFKDGTNAGRVAKDYKKETIEISQNKQVEISMAPGGGYVMRIFKVN